MKRASSTIYYALFHELARCCADSFIGVKSADRAERAWVQVYRFIDHGLAASQCRKSQSDLTFPDEVRDFADHFASMQTKRNDCDYNPKFRIPKLDVQADLLKAKEVIQGFRTVQSKHRRAFSAYVMLRGKGR